MKEMQSAPALRRWSRQEYERMITKGLIHSGDRVELIDGEIWTMAAHGSAHFAAIYAAQKALEAVFGSGYQVRVQGPIALDDWSEPEPDVAVVAGSFRDYVKDHPGRALLVVEVADSTLSTDRNRKGSLYARGGVQDYWIVNLSKRILEIYREPVEDPRSRYYGWKYRLVQRCGPEEYVSPLAMPKARIKVGDLLP